MVCWWVEGEAIGVAVGIRKCEGIVVAGRVAGTTTSVVATVCCAAAA